MSTFDETTMHDANEENNPSNDIQPVEEDGGNVEQTKRAHENNHYDYEEFCGNDLNDEAQEVEKSQKMSSLRAFCCPNMSIPKEMYIPFVFCTISVIFTGVGSWYCRYFQGAAIVFTSARYGIWTLQDASGKCQLWDQLFFSYNLGPFLHASRAFSMLAQLGGLALVAVLSQALQFHAGSWLIVAALGSLFLTSVFSTGLFNLWTFFFLFTYVIFILLVRFLFIHPVHRRISKRGCKYIVGACTLCSVFSFLTLIILRSDYCTCNSLDSDRLEGRVAGNECSNVCQLDVSGILMVFAGISWLVTAAAVHKFGVQPETLQQNEAVLSTHAYYPKKSITSRMVTTVQAVNETMISPFKSSFESNLNSSETKDKEKDDKNEDEDNDDKTEVDPRTRCKKFCFDYRVTNRSRKEQCLFWSFRVLLGILLFFYFFFIALKIGSFYESDSASKAPDTTPFFTLDDVCAFNPNNTDDFKSYPTKQDASNEGYVVAHCGKCANCSNAWDIQRYVETRKIIAIEAKKCGFTATFGTYQELTNCLQKRINFSPPCTDCWVKNMISTAEYCLFTCMKATFIGSARANNVKGTGNETVWLNQCIFCDERMSGPDFVTCSGVARRRLGIRSEIERDPMQQCRNMDVDWVNVDFNDLFPNLQDPNLEL